MAMEFRRFAVFALLCAASFARAQVPTEVQLPGTQPGQVPNTQDSNFCNNCHGGYSPAVEPWRQWLGGPMAHATRDPLYWAATAIADQDFPGAGDLCLRCHTPLGWLAGRSMPTDGAALTAADFDGVSCHVCHRVTDPDRSEHLGVQTAPFLANDEQNPATAYLGSGMYVIWPGNERIGPYSSGINPPHTFLGSSLHRSSDLCGTCHDVSNPVTGDLAHNHGAQQPLAPGTYSGVPGAPVEQKAAFNNFPHQYGVVERTFSEHRSTPLSSMRMFNYASLPADLRDGSIERAHDAALASTPTGDYVDGAPRTFTCQSCHMPPVTGKGASQSAAPLRTDLPLHDMTGGNYWINDAIKWLDDRGRLVGGGGLGATQRAAMSEGDLRAKSNLEHAASLSVVGRTLRVTNLTGHKLISGYPEGRRMWLRTRWYDLANALVREDGAYGALNVNFGGQSVQVQTLLDLSGANTRIYEAEMGLTQEWAQQLLALGYSPSLPLEFDRVSGAVVFTLGQLGAQAPGSTHKSFHFALANTLVKDNRIPPWRMSYDAARTRNILPVPPTQYGAPGPGGEFEHFDELELSPPPGAVRAQIELVYQPTSWEYVQFLSLANTGASANLATVGQGLYEAWVATGMAAPHVMASASWDWTPPSVYCTAKVNSLGCTPAIGWSGVPSAQLASGFAIGAVHLLNQKSGLLFYGLNGADSQPFQGGWMCVANPLRRTATQNSGGSSGAVVDCSGQFTFDFNARIASGVDPALVAGQQVWAQYWSRDPASSSTTNLTDALEFIIQ
jgi:hypothetical protein